MQLQLQVTICDAYEGVDQQSTLITKVPLFDHQGWGWVHVLVKDAGKSIDCICACVFDAC